jgi:hypothetical protein
MQVSQECKWAGNRVAGFAVEKAMKENVKMTEMD